MTAGQPRSRACPDCRAALDPLHSKMNLGAEQCPQGHGIFLDPSDVSQLVGPSTLTRIRNGVKKGRVTQAPCPNCDAALVRLSLGEVPARGCSACASLWFNTEDLKAHVLQVRTRAYGAGSMAARADVARDATAFYPGEVVAGILTEYALESTP